MKISNKVKGILCLVAAAAIFFLTFYAMSGWNGIIAMLCIVAMLAMFFVFIGLIILGLDLIKR